MIKIMQKAMLLLNYVNSIGREMGIRYHEDEAVVNVQVIDEKVSIQVGEESFTNQSSQELKKAVDKKLKVILQKFRISVYPPLWDEICKKLMTYIDNFIKTGDLTDTDNLRNYDNLFIEGVHFCFGKWTDDPDKRGYNMGDILDPQNKEKFARLDYNRYLEVYSNDKLVLKAMKRKGSQGNEVYFEPNDSFSKGSLISNSNLLSDIIPNTTFRAVITEGGFDKVLQSQIEEILTLFFLVDDLECLKKYREGLKFTIYNKEKEIIVQHQSPCTDAISTNFSLHLKVGTNITEIKFEKTAKGFSFSNLVWSDNPNVHCYNSLNAEISKIIGANPEKMSQHPYLEQVALFLAGIQPRQNSFDVDPSYLLNPAPDAVDPHARPLGPDNAHDGAPTSRHGWHPILP